MRITSTVLQQELGRIAGEALVRVWAVAGGARIVAVLAGLSWLIDEVVGETGVLTRVVQSPKFALLAYVTVEFGSEEAFEAGVVAAVAQLGLFGVVLAYPAVDHTVVIQGPWDPSDHTASALVDTRTTALGTVRVAGQILVGFEFVVEFSDQRHELAVPGGQERVGGIAGEAAEPRLLAAGLAPVMALHAPCALQIGAVRAAQAGRGTSQQAAGQAVGMTGLALVRVLGGVLRACWTYFLAEARPGTDCHKSDRVDEGVGANAGGALVRTSPRASGAVLEAPEALARLVVAVMAGFTRRSAAGASA